MNSNILHEITTRSFAGTIAFPEVVKLLLKAGVESYFVDLIGKGKTHHFTKGEAASEKFEFQGPPVAAEFSAENVVAAIRSSQAGKITYPEFLRQIMLAGVSHYHVYLTGRKAVYFSRKGDFHTELFPSNR